MTGDNEREHEEPDLIDQVLALRAQPPPQPVRCEVCPAPATWQWRLDVYCDKHVPNVDHPQR